MITQPLELQSRLSRSPRDLDFFAWVNVGLIALLFGVLGSRFVLMPVVPVGLKAETLELPRVEGTLEAAGRDSVVVSYHRDNVILFEGGIYGLTDLRQHLEAYQKKHPGAVMLVQVHRQVSAQAFLELCEMAREIGFAQVLVPVEQPSGETPTP
ncbi:MAG TPA: biopolymer transporter ExbD [Lacunisphaera sp.]|nr:biopolymer transporter ExbD [Lacunisphaera sp.]